MAQLNKQPQTFTPAKPTIISWDSFRGGLNSLLNPTEIQGTELAQSDNLLLTGLGTPTKRWGYQTYFMAGATGAVRGIAAYYNGTTNELLSLTDGGYLSKKSNASYTQIVGASWPSGYEATMTQLDNKVYIVQQQRPLVRYAGATLISFATIGIPTTLGITNLSGASGLGELTAVAYRVSAEGRIGETVASPEISLASVQADPTKMRTRITWTTVSAASGDITGYIIYGRQPGNETFLARVTKDTLTYDDDGTDTPSITIEPPTADTTGGPSAKFIERYKDRLIIAGIPGEPTKVMFSGRVPNQEKFHWSYGGGYVLIDPDSGESITGIKVLRDKILIFKERSIWQMSIGSLTIGTTTLADPQYDLLTASHGCVSHKTIVPVEDDVFFLTRRGVYAVGYKPNILNVLSTTEISAKVRDKFEALNPAQWSMANAEYKDFKYIISYPETGQSAPNKILIFDRERTAWMGPWSVAGSSLYRYYDANNSERLVFGSTASAFVYDLSSDYTTDNGTAIPTILRTKKEDFNTWNLFKTIKDIFLQFRNVVGAMAVDIFVEQRNGQVVAAKSFTITPTTGNSGWGSYPWGGSSWGNSPESAGSGDVTEILRWITLNATGRSIQIQIKTSDGSANYKLLGVKLEGQVQGKGSIPASYRV